MKKMKSLTSSLDLPRRTPIAVEQAWPLEHAFRLATTVVVKNNPNMLTMKHNNVWKEKYSPELV